MKKIRSVIVCICILFTLASCEKDEGKLPDLSFKTGPGYISANDTIAGDSTFTVGINAAKTEDEDYLKQFTISQSINDSPTYIVRQVTLSGGDRDKFATDFVTSLSPIHRQKNRFSFTISNRDGLVNQLELVLYVK